MMVVHVFKSVPSKNCRIPKRWGPQELLPFLRGIIIGRGSGVSSPTSSSSASCSSPWFCWFRYFFYPRSLILRLRERESTRVSCDCADNKGLDPTREPTFGNRECECESDSSGDSRILETLENTLRNAHKMIIEEQGLYISERGGAFSLDQKSLPDSTGRINATVRRGLADPGMRTDLSVLGSVTLMTISEEGR